MNHQRQIIRFTLAGLFIALGALFVGTTRGFAQQPATERKGVVREKTAGRDPFRKYELVAPKAVKSSILVPPTIQERIERYKAQKIAAMNAQLPAPKPTTALLLGEVQVIGIFRTPRGYAAMVEALPIKLSYVIYPGERFFDGQLVAIEENRLVFRRESVWLNGKRDYAVEIKPLRQPSPVEAMAATKAAPAQAPVAEQDKKQDDKPVTPAKP